MNLIEGSISMEGCTPEELIRLQRYFPGAEFRTEEYVSRTENESEEDWMSRRRAALEKRNADLSAKRPGTKALGYVGAATFDLDAYLQERFPGTITINRVLPVSVKTTDDAVQSMISVLRRLEKVSEHFNDVTFNQTCDVHMGGFPLMTVNRVLLLEDTCTDRLQDALDKGWRILSVNVQPDQRRSDYVLGRWDPERETARDGAARNPENGGRR